MKKFASKHWLLALELLVLFLVWSLIFMYPRPTTCHTTHATIVTPTVTSTKVDNRVNGTLAHAIWVGGLR